MSATRAGDAPRTDLPFLGDVTAQLVRVLVVDLVDLLLAEEARAPANRPGRARALACLLLASLFSWVCHRLRTGCRRLRSPRSRRRQPRSLRPERTAARPRLQPRRVRRGTGLCRR